MKRILIVALLVLATLCTERAWATFLGLGVGDYSFTLSNSSALCGGSNCVGTVSITGDPATVANFSWNFTVNGDTFNWTQFRDVTGSGNNSCAIESVSSQTTLGTDATNCFIAVGNADQKIFYLENSILQPHTWLYHGPTGTGLVRSDNFVAVPINRPVPEPMSLWLLGSGLAAVRFRTLFRRK